MGQKVRLRIDNIIPQTYRLALITFGETTEVIQIPLGQDETAEIRLQIGEEINEVVLVVTGTTRFTRQKAAYKVEILEE